MAKSNKSIQIAIKCARYFVVVRKVRQSSAGAWKLDNCKGIYWKSKDGK